VRFGDTRLRFETDGVTRAIPTSSEASFGRVIGISPEMRALYPVFQRVAEADVAVLIEGETGTGKEVLAESLHDRSARANGPFVVMDCTTISPSLLEAELFGHERGAFTGAVSTRRGLFEEAAGGTLFIDEIGDLDLGLQAKLLRALEKKEVRRVGGTQWLRLDVRVIAATRRDLDREVAARRFRDDLYYRLAVARVELPALRRRQGDIAFLTRFLWSKLGGDEAALSPDVIQRFESYDWPGNVRELANAVARQIALGDFEPAMHGHAPQERRSTPPGVDTIDQIVRSGQPMTAARQRVIDEFERRYTKHMLDLHGGNVTRAAAASGIGRRYFQMVRAKRPQS
jgi:DNA-binding NtrC family response regulator